MFLYIFFGIVNLVVLSLLIPSFEVHTPTVYLDSVAIKSLNTKVDNLTAIFDLTLLFHTPNYEEEIVSYNDLEIRVLWPRKNEITLAKMNLPPFLQEADTVTMIGVELKVADGLSNNSYVSIGIGIEKSNGSVQIGVSLLGKFSLRNGTSKKMKFDFDHVVVKFPPGSNNGTWKWVEPRHMY
jgi:hypothetical protein